MNGLRVLFWFIGLLLLLVVLFVAACGKQADTTVSTQQGSQADGSQDLIEVRISYNKNGGQTPQYVAENYGFYEKHGLKVTSVQFDNTANAIGAMNAGEVDIIASIPSEPLVARYGGFDLVAIMQNETSNFSAPDSGALMVRTDSDISNLKDLEGKKIACKSYSSQDCVNGQYAMKRAGVDLAKVQIVEAPFPTHYDLLNSNQVDAVETVDPFTTQILTSGLGRVLLYTYVETVPGQTLGAWWVERKWLEENEETARKFQAAIKDAIDYLHEDENRARRIVGEFTSIDESILNHMPLLNWNYNVNPEIWDQENDVLVEMGALPQKPDPEEYFSDIIRPFFVSP